MPRDVSNRRAFYRISNDPERRQKWITTKQRPRIEQRKTERPSSFHIRYRIQRVLTLIPRLFHIFFLQFLTVLIKGILDVYFYRGFWGANFERGKVDCRRLDTAGLEHCSPQYTTNNIRRHNRNNANKSTRRNTTSEGTKSTFFH